jgi:large subunit ribosomal protein L14e
MDRGDASCSREGGSKMALYDIGRLCVKIAGRDANKRCVIVDVKDAHTVLIDGETRRRHCNVVHLEPLQETLDVKKGASHAEVAAAFKGLGIELGATKPKKAAARPKQVRKAKTQPAEEQKVAKPKRVKVEKPGKEAAPAAAEPDLKD